MSKFPNPERVQRELHLLLLAPCCDGQDVGEAWSTFQWVRGVAAKHNVTVLTYRKRGHRSLQAQLEEVRVSARVIEWDDLPLVHRAARLNSMLKPGYVPFFFKARRWIRRALAAGEHFDGAHQLAPLALRYPSPLAGLGLPWLLGPLGGSLQTPAGFQKELGGAPWYTKLRGMDALRLRLDPWLRASLRDAKAIFAVAPYVEDLLRPATPQRVLIESETGVTALPSQSRKRTSSTPRILFVGRIVRTKGLLFGLRALASLTDLDWHMDIAGSGEDELVCKTFAEEHGLDQRITFHGQVARKKVDELYSGADLFLFPSFREPSGNVIFEALSFGVPVLCCDAGGPGFVAKAAGSICVPATNPSALEKELRQELHRLLRAPGELVRRGQLGVQYIKERAMWKAKLERLFATYADAFGLSMRAAKSKVSQAETAPAEYGL